MKPRVGDCFTYDRHHHLYVLLHFERNFPAFGQHHFIAVNISKTPHPKEQCCILMPGDHPYIAVPSHVRYDMMCSFDASSIERHLLNPGAAKQRMDTDVVERIIECAHKSKFLDRRYKAVLPQPTATPSSSAPAPAASP